MGSINHSYAINSDLGDYWLALPDISITPLEIRSKPVSHISTEIWESFLVLKAGIFSYLQLYIKTLHWGSQGTEIREHLLTEICHKPRRMDIFL